MSAQSSDAAVVLSRCENRELMATLVHRQRESDSRTSDKCNSGEEFNWCL